MTTQHSLPLSLIGAVALALVGTAPLAVAQQMPPPPPPPPQVPAPPPPTPPQPPAPPAPPTPPAPAAPATVPPPPEQSTPPPPSTAPPPAAQPAPATTSTMSSSDETGALQTGQFYQGTESSAQYRLPDSNGGTLTVNAGMPAHVQNYGPPPSFGSLDTNHNGCISESEAQAYPPLDSDFLFASNQGKCISKAQYRKWVNSQGGSP